MVYLVPRDYYLFPNLKKEPRRERFVDSEELKAAINVHFSGKEEIYFLQEIDKLSRFNIFIEAMVDYIEKYNTFGSIH